MLTYSLDERNGLSLYDYLYRCIKNDILSGKIKAGEKLPSKRALAKNLGVSVITVENAYSQLLAEGFSDSVEKKGYYVADISIDRMEKSHVKKNIPEKLYESNEQQFVADFVTNTVSIDKFPFSQWSKLTRNILSAESAELLIAAPSEGVFELRKAIADYLYNFRGIEVSPSQIVVGSGTEYLYGILLQLLGHDNIYAMENPGYSKVYSILKGNGVSCQHIDIDDKGMRIDRLIDSGANIVHLTPSHHFPTGIVMPVSRRFEFLEWAAGNDESYIIEDDYDCEFRLQGRPIQTMFESDNNGKVIYMNTFSKTLAPSFRISYMVLPLHLMERFKKKLGYMSCTVPNLFQYVLAEFMSKGYFERHINRMRVVYRARRDELLAAIKNSRLSEKTDISEENSGLHFLLKVKTDITDKELVKRAGERGINIRCLSDYTYGEVSGNEHMLIMNYSGIEPEMIKEAVNILSEVIIE